MNPNGVPASLLTREMAWPEDLHPDWANVLRRLQSAHTQHGITIVTIHVILDETGKPVKWAKPTQVALEPRSDSGEFLALLAKYLGG